MRNAKEKVMLLGSYAGTAAIACKRFMILFFFLNVLRGSFHGLSLIHISEPTRRS